MKKVKFKLGENEHLVAHHNLSDVKEHMGFVFGKTEKVDDCAILTRKVIINNSGFNEVIIFNNHYAEEAEIIKIEKKYKCRECGIEIDEKGICEQCIEEKQLDVTDKVDEEEEEENNEEIEVLE